MASDRYVILTRLWALPFTPPLLCAELPFSLGSVTELMGDLDRAMAAYENALRQNPYSIPAMNSISCILRTKEQFAKAVEYLQSILNLDANNGDIWGSLGHCYLMMDELQKAYSAYQQALYHLRDPKVHSCPPRTCALVF